MSTACAALFSAASMLACRESSAQPELFGLTRVLTECAGPSTIHDRSPITPTTPCSQSQWYRIRPLEPEPNPAIDFAITPAIFRPQPHPTSLSESALSKVSKANSIQPSTLAFFGQQADRTLRPSYATGYNQSPTRPPPRAPPQRRAQLAAAPRDMQTKECRLSDML